LRTLNALDALVTREQVRAYVSSRRLKQCVLLVGSRIKSGSEFHAIGPSTKNARRPQVLSRVSVSFNDGTTESEMTKYYNGPV